MDQDDNFKNSIGLLGIDRAISQAIGTQSHQQQQQQQQQQQRSPGISNTSASSSGGAITTSASSDTITNVYSIIMDESGTSDGGGSPLDQFSEHQISADQEVELNSTGGGDGASHHLVGVMDESEMVRSISSVSGISGVSGIQIGISSSPPVISIPPTVGLQVGGSGSVHIGGHTLAKRSLLHSGNTVSSVPTAMKPSPVSKPSPPSNSVGSGAGGLHGYKGSPTITEEVSLRYLQANNV